MKNNNSLSKYSVILLVVFMTVQLLIPMIYRVKGISMEPEYHNNDYVIINYYTPKKVYNFGDVVVIAKDKEHRQMLKRVIGVGGDHIQIIENDLYVNGIIQKESYILEKMNTKDMDFIIPKDNLFVLGDNRNDSIDSRQIGLIHTSSVLGKVIFHF